MVLGLYMEVSLYIFFLNFVLLIARRLREVERLGPKTLG